MLDDAIHGNIFRESRGGKIVSVLISGSIVSLGRVFTPIKNLTKNLSVQENKI